MSNKSKKIKLENTYLLASFLFAFFMVILYITIKTKVFENFEGVPDVSFPFRNMFDSRGQKLNVILITAPFREEQHEKLYQEYKLAGLHFCGISSYQSFPDKIHNPYEDRFHEERGHDYPKMVSSWLHCFRDIPKVISDSKIPTLLMTEADLKDWRRLTFRKSVKKQYDFLYVCLQDNEECAPGWQSYNRNWDLGKKCVEIMCRDYKLKGLIVGRNNCDFTEECKDKVTLLPFLDYAKFQEEMQKCKFLFVPNISDASPRIATEAMCYDMPVLMNYNIVGGWHNIIPGITGEFFTDENDIHQPLSKIIRGGYRPKNWFQTNRGRTVSGALLSKFISTVYEGQLNSTHLRYVYVSI
jgi:hypothetical protein